MSGLSSGAFFATQLHVAYSSSIKGAGIVAGGPYDCAGQMSYTSCMYTSSPSIAKSISNTKLWSGNQIDPISSLSKQKIYMISGTSDTTVGPSVMNQLYKYYVTDGQFIPSANVSFKKDLKSAHTFPTDFDSNGNNLCSSTSSPYISNCAFDGAGAILEHIYGKLKERNNGNLNGKFIEVHQGEFLSNPKSFGMDDNGWIYLPSNCQRGDLCKLHVAFHGCLQGYQKIGDKFVKNTGFNRWADTNNLIIFYPQAVSTNTIGGSASIPNANGCWDWVGWYGKDFDQKTGQQISTIKKMIDRITNGFNPLSPPTDLQSIDIKENSIKIQWTSVSKASGYNIYRNEQKINSNLILTTIYLDENLQSGRTYEYYLKSLSSSGSESSPSNRISVKTTGESSTSEIPSGLSLFDITTKSISLKWNSIVDVDNYFIYRNGNQIANTIVSNYKDEYLNSGVEYQYEITSMRNSIESERSNPIRGQTLIEKVCFNDNNYNHVLQGRAYLNGGYVFANGSNQKMGLYNIFIKTNLCKTNENYFIIE